MTTDDKKYEPDTFRDIVRSMPGMFIGGTGQSALEEVLLNLVEQMIDESLLGNTSQVAVNLWPGNLVRVDATGPGLSLDADYWASINTKTSLFIHNDSKEYNRRTQMNGFRKIPISTIQAISERCEIEIRRDGYTWRTVYSKGEQIEALHQVEPLIDPDNTGTSISFTPDYTIFQPVSIDANWLRNILNERAFLVSSLTLSLTDKTGSTDSATEIFHYANGTADYVRALNRVYTPLHEPVIIRETVMPEGRDVVLEIVISFQYNDSEAFFLLNFVNGRQIVYGGTHVEGFLDGLQDRFFGDLTTLYAGLTAVVSIWYTAPQFAGSMRQRLDNPEVRQAIMDAVIRSTNRFYDDEAKTSFRTSRDLIHAKHDRNVNWCEKRRLDALSR